MEHFEVGDRVTILSHGMKMEVVVFRQLGAFVYLSDKENRVYQFPVDDVLAIDHPQTPSLTAV
ncbi:hypothetical protein DYQ86_20535 [Acidobacteria bacterium AB60]|nr:hypothetical protein DYQ86_20535 [Acidobacteria bacterium AB60]